MNSWGLVRAVLNRAHARGPANSPPRRLHPPELPSRSFRSMGTMASVTFGGGYADRIESVTEEIRAIFDRLESEMSVYRPRSAVSELTRMAGVAPVAVPEHTYRVLSLGQRFARLSAGAFSITSSP